MSPKTEKIDNSFTAFVNMLKWCYVGEQLIALEIFSLLSRENEKHSDKLVQLLAASEQHKIKLAKILQQLSFEDTYTFENLELEAIRILDSFLRWDQGNLSYMVFRSYLLYKELTSYFDNYVKCFCPDDVSYEVLKTLKELAEDQLNHYKIAIKIGGSP